MFGDKITREQLFPNGNVSTHTVDVHNHRGLGQPTFCRTGSVINQQFGTILPT